MFNLFKKNVELYAPVVGHSVKLENVPDPMFANKLLGDGIAFEYEGDTVYAPCDGEVIMIAATSHAVGIQTKNKAEIMIHIGLDTVNLNGKGFQLLTKVGDKVKQGQPLIKFDRALFNDKKINMITPMIVTSKQFNLEIIQEQHVDLTTPAIKVSKSNG